MHALLLTRGTRRVRAAALTLVVACGLALGVVALPDGADAQTTGFPSVGTNFAAAGPYQVATQSDATNTFFFPSNLGVDGLKHPVILWGNGTFTQVTNYEALLRHFASHGFIVAAANTSNAGSGNEMLTGLNTLQTWNGQSGNRFFGKVDLTRVGSTGHSQGGGGAEATGRDGRVDTVFPAQPWLGNPPGRGTAIYFAGQSDTVVAPSTVRDDYDQSSGIPAAYAELAGASHFIPVNDGGGYRGAMTAWARWQLMGDTIARGQFVGAGCGLCTSSAWSAYSANALLAGSGGPTTTGPGPTTTRPQPTTTTTAPWWCFWCGWFG